MALRFEDLPADVQEQIRKSDAVLSQTHDGLSVPVARVGDIDPGGRGTWRCETCDHKPPTLAACKRHSEETGHLRIACSVERR